MVVYYPVLGGSDLFTLTKQCKRYGGAVEMHKEVLDLIVVRRDHTEMMHFSGKCLS